MEHCEVLIVGGGPAGSSCARELTRRGLEVTVMDRSSFPRDKVCAGWITPQLIASLELDLGAYAHGRTLQPVSGFASGLMSGSPITVRYPAPISYAIRRCEFDDYLLRRSGARLLLGSAIESLQQLANGWIVNGTLHCQLLIGAGGHFCPVARQLGAHVGRAERAIYAQEVELKLSDSDMDRCRVAAAVPELYFCDDLSGYGWCVRKGDYLNVGLGREAPNHLAAELHRFWSALVASDRAPRAAQPGFKGHAYLLYKQSQRTWFTDNCLLIGDAAGLAYPHSGEGIRPAVDSALLAARVIGDSRGDYRRSRLAAYAHALESHLGARTPAGAMGQAATLPGLRQRLGRFLMQREPFVRHVLINQYFLHRWQPALRA